MLKGNLDVVDLRQVVGWAQDDAQPDVPVSLLITDNDQLIGRILANRYRADLEQAMIGSGRHSFEFQFAKSLTPFENHVLRVRRESDGADLAQSPVTLEAAQAFDLSVQEALADIIQRSGTEQDIAAKIDFLAGISKNCCNSSPNTTASAPNATIINSFCNAGGERPRRC